MNIDRFSPATVGEDKIKLAVHSETIPKVGFVCEIGIDYSKCLPEGASLPIEVVVQGPSEASYRTRTYRSSKPSQFSFTPREVGEHLVLVRELSHNRWLGTVRLTVAGDIVG